MGGLARVEYSMNLQCGASLRYCAYLQNLFGKATKVGQKGTIVAHFEFKSVFCQGGPCKREGKVRQSAHLVAAGYNAG